MNSIALLLIKMDEKEDQDQIQINLILDKWFELQQIIKEGITLNKISIILHIFTIIILIIL